jgi:hypothetical protein
MTLKNNKQEISSILNKFVKEYGVNPVENDKVEKNFMYFIVDNYLTTHKRLIKQRDEVLKLFNGDPKNNEIASVLPELAVE